LGVYLLKIKLWGLLTVGIACCMMLLLPMGFLFAESDFTHPRLVSIDATKCITCHEDLLRGFTAVHSPVEDDCSTCHDVEISDAGTLITLTEQEPELCLLCHDEMAAAAAAELDVPHAPVTDSCLSCHTPHAAPTSQLLLSPVAELCQDCHDLEELETAHDGQITETTDCLQCHGPHGTAVEHMLNSSRLHSPFADGTCASCHRQPFAGRTRLKARGEKLCLACHDDVAADGEGGGSVHQALFGQRSRAGCLSCHDPHMSANSSLLKQKGNALCRTCHEDVVQAAEASTGHEPAAEDCLNCHLPHSAGQPSLLDESPPALCTMCHDTDDEELSRAHLGAGLGSLECTACHSPHGAGNEKLLARTVHPPVLDGCDTCHLGGADQLLEEGESALCLMCHDDIGEAANSAPVPHAAMEMARCADCHNAHASPQAHLLTAPSGGECIDCHEEMAAGEGEVAHGVVDLIGCRACHEPHGGENEKLLRISGSELCLGCHDSARMGSRDDDTPVKLLGRFEVTAEVARGMASLRLSADGQHNHPVTGHRVLGTPSDDNRKRIDTTFTGEFTCLTCHDPHKGASRQLLRWGAESSLQACSNCHPK
jgi:predicted CXXCH cytochrome family protein